MVFTSPMVLWALSLIAIPIAIHLFQFRRYKKIFFSDVSLLKEVKTTSQTKNQLKHLLVLLLRCLFIIFLVTAFAEPIIPSNDQADEVDQVTVYVDNSFSMQASTGSGSLLQIANQAAYDIASTFPRGTRFQLITNDFLAREKRFTDTDEFIEQLDNLTSSPEHRTVEEVLRFQAQALGNQSSNIKTFLLTDFNRMLSDAELPTDSTNNLSILPLSAGVPENVSVDSAWLRTPITQVNVEQQMMLRVTNHGSEPIQNLEVEVTLDDERVAAPILDLPANGSIDTSLTFIPSKAGYLTGQISVDDYPISFDNTLYFTVYVSDVINVVEVIGDGAPEKTPFRRLFSGDAFSYRSFSEAEIKQEAFDDAQVVILHGVEELSSGLVAIAMDKLDNGGSVLLVLPEEASSSLKGSLKENFKVELTAWDSVKLEVNYLNERHFLFENVFDAPLENPSLPVVSGHYGIGAGSGGDAVMRLFNGDALIFNKSIGNGEFFVIPTPLTDKTTNLHRHALFVPAMINMAAHAGLGRPLSYPITAKVVKTSARDEQTEMKSLNDSARFIPGMSHNGILLNQDLLHPGHWALVSGDSTLEVFSFNYDRTESNIDLPTAREIEDYFSDRQLAVQVFDQQGQDLSIDVVEANVGTKLWPIFALLAMVMLLLETAILKMFSK